MIPRRQQPRHVERVALKLAAAAVACVAVTVPATAAGATAGQPPTALFRQGYNLCRAASLRAIRKAGREQYKAGTFSHNICTWERSDLKAGVALSTHPKAVGKALMRMFKTQSGKQHVTARPLKVPRATKALLVTVPSGEPTEHTKYLFASYRRGVIQVNMTAPNSLPIKRLKAMLALVSHIRGR